MNNMAHHDKKSEKDALFGYYDVVQPTDIYEGFISDEMQHCFYIINKARKRV